MDGLQWRFHDWPIGEYNKRLHTFGGNLKRGAAEEAPYEVS